jgi:SAM-dependent methyltransferase
MKIRESGMPSEDVWNEFFKPDTILRTLGLDGNMENVADFGCGYGTFSIPAAKMISGKVYAIDTVPEMVEATQKKARESRVNNIETMLRDIMAEGSGLENESVDYVALFNVLHAEDPIKLLKDAYRILRPNGKIGIIHWIYDPTTPRGPPMAIRPKPEQCIEWATISGFKNPKIYSLNPYHYGIAMEKGI